MNVSNKLQIAILCSFLIAVAACDSRSTVDSKMSSPASTTNSQTFIAGVATPADDNSIRDEFLLPKQKGYVNDFANIFDIKTKEELEQSLTNFREQAKIDIVIVTVRTTGDKTAFDYSIILAKQWAVGVKNPDKAGILMLIAVEDRKWHIQITRGLEKILSNSEVEELGGLMRSPFRENKYGDGVKKCVEEFIKVLTERRVK